MVYKCAAFELPEVGRLTSPGSDNPEPESENLETEELPRSRRFVQIAGAVIVTAFALWFLFGIPVYLLFAQFLSDILE